jgi:mRNA (guanine-N7-)-methyltransferase
MCISLDIANVSVQQADTRYREGRYRFKADFYALDCFQQNLSEVITSGEVFDLVSCQFAFHYCAESESKARKAVENVASVLKPGGHFIGTVPDAYRIMQVAICLGYFL